MGSSLYLEGGVSVPAHIDCWAPMLDEVTVVVDRPPLARELLAQGGPFEARLTESGGETHGGSAFLTHSVITPERERYTLLVQIQPWIV